ncbi:hypothetical protein ACNQGB_18510 [Flavobacterium sp. XS1P32]|uniref:hypothetical protein n=1 Tax=Flavobacterium sp. XS1P32 TaxID=3401726 RepID=UPI003AADD580
MENYKKVKFKITKTQHLLIKAKINGVIGNFILDTGASNSCVRFESIDLFYWTQKNQRQKPQVLAPNKYLPNWL